MSVNVYDKSNNFRQLMTLDFGLASILNVGDCVYPNCTGFAFVIVDKLVSKDLEDSDYSLSLNVVEYRTKKEKIKLYLGLKVIGYWDWLLSK